MRLPYNADLSEYGLLILMADDGNWMGDLISVLEESMVGFTSLLRRGEMEANELRDITLSRAGGAEYIRIFIRKQKHIKKKGAYSGP